MTLLATLVACAVIIILRWPKREGLSIAGIMRGFSGLVKNSVEGVGQDLSKTVDTFSKSSKASTDELATALTNLSPEVRAAVEPHVSAEVRAAAAAQDAAAALQTVSKGSAKGAVDAATIRASKLHADDLVVAANKQSNSFLVKLARDASDIVQDNVDYVTSVLSKTEMNAAEARSFLVNLVKDQKITKAEANKVVDVCDTPGIDDATKALMKKDIETAASGPPQSVWKTIAKVGGAFATAIGGIAGIVFLAKSFKPGGDSGGGSPGPGQPGGPPGPGSLTDPAVFIPIAAIVGGGCLMVVCCLSMFMIMNMGGASTTANAAAGST